jgi:hypothetical protein
MKSLFKLNKIKLLFVVLLYFKFNFLFSYAFYPIFFYTPNTGFSLGAGFVNKFEDSKYAIDHIVGNVIITQKMQFLINAVPTFYFNKVWKFQPVVLYKYFPKKLYGFGNNTSDGNFDEFISRKYMLQGVIFREILSNLNIGVVFDFNNVDINLIKPHYLNSNITGFNGGNQIGMGWGLEIDTRDFKRYPSNGLYWRLHGMYYSKFIGSDYDFHSYLFDFRYFYNIYKSHIIAFQFLGMMQFGDIPFYYYPSLGNQYDRMRSIRKGRFQDKNIVISQIEYRFPIYKKFKGALFADTGDVFDSVKNIFNIKLKYGLGFGLRYNVSTKNKINYRYDFSFGSKGMKHTITFFEAF